MRPVHIDPAQTELPKNLKAHWVWAIALGSAIGWGAFILPSDWIEIAGPGGALLGLTIGGALMLIIGVSYGFLTRVFPVSGGAFVYALVSFGRFHGFVTGWFMTLGYISIVALNASALGVLAKHLVPDLLHQKYLYSVAGWEVYVGEIAVAILALTIFALVNIVGAESSSRYQYYMVIVMVSAILILSFGVGMAPSSGLSNLAPVFNPEIGALAGSFAIVAIAPWAFIGFDNIPQTAEEFDFPARKASRLISLSIVAATGLYLLMILMTGMGTIAPSEVNSQSSWQVADIVTNALGPAGLIILSIAAFMGIATGLNGFYIAASRALLALGRARLIPTVFAVTNRRFRTPSVGIIFVMLVSFIAPWFGRVALNWVVDMASIGFTIAFFYTSLAAYKLFGWTNQPSASKESASTTGKIASAAGVVIAVFFTLLLLLPTSPAHLEAPSLFALASTLHESSLALGC